MNPSKPYTSRSELLELASKLLIDGQPRRVRDIEPLIPERLYTTETALRQYWLQNKKTRKSRTAGQWVREGVYPPLPDGVTIKDIRIRGLTRIFRDARPFQVTRDADGEALASYAPPADLHKRRVVCALCGQSLLSQDAVRKITVYEAGGQRGPKGDKTKSSKLARLPTTWLCRPHYEQEVKALGAIVGPTRKRKQQPSIHVAEQEERNQQS